MVPFQLPAGLLAVTVATDWVTVAFQALDTCCPPAYVQTSVHPAIAFAPLFVIFMVTVAPPDHSFCLVCEIAQTPGEAGGLTETDGETLGDGLTLGLGDALRDGLGEALGEALREGLADVDGDADEPPGALPYTSVPLSYSGT